MPPRKFKLGDLAVEQGLITAEQLQQALDHQRALREQGQHAHLGELLIRDGHLSTRQIERLLEAQEKRVLVCPECFVRFNVLNFKEGKTYRCRKCGAVLIPADQASDSQVTQKVHQIEVDSQDERIPLAGRAVLRIVSGSRQGTEMRVAEGETLHIGSRDDVDLILADPGVVELHCKVRSNGVDLMLYDYHAKGTTQVNGKPVDYLRLCDGDKVQIGSVEIHVAAWEAEEAAEAAEVATEPDPQVAAPPDPPEPEPARQPTAPSPAPTAQTQAPPSPEPTPEPPPPTEASTEAPVEEPRRQTTGKRQRTSRQDVLFGRTLLDRGLVKAEDINWALQEQDRRRRDGQRARMGELLIERGVITAEDLDEVLTERKKAKKREILRCPGCKTGYNVTERDPGFGFKCTSCGEILTVPGADATQPPTATEDVPMQRQPTKVKSRSDRKAETESGELEEDSVEAQVVPDEMTEVDLAAAFSKLAVQERFVTPDQLRRCVGLQGDDLDGGGPTIGELMVRERYLTPHQHHQLLVRLGQRVPPVDIPGYCLINQLGKGGTGAVYYAVMLKGRLPVALKVVRPELAADENFVRRFYREAEIAMRINHPNIIGGVDVGQHAKVLYMAMEYVEGESADGYLKREGRMSERYSIEVGYQVALALHYASSHSLIHRDVKPDNIVITRAGTVKLIDLGLAKQVTASGSADLTTTGMILGTPRYISPEQARGERMIDLRSDVYSLGASLYHMVVGEPPFTLETPMQTMMAHIMQEAVPPAERIAEVSPGYSRLIMRMMAKDPNDRFQSWDAVATELDVLISN